MGVFTGIPSRVELFSQLSPQQQQLQSQLTGAAMGQGRSGPYGQSASYYQDLMGGNNTYNALAAPEMRQFNEETMPGIAEQFAGMGAGGSFGGNFQNATAQAGVGLAERLASMRAGLRQQGAQGMMGMGQQALSPHMQNVQFPRTPGLFEILSKLAIQGAGMFGGGFLGSLGSQEGISLISKMMEAKDAKQEGS